MSEPTTAGSATSASTGELKTPVDLVLDVLVFSPIGFMADARDLVPKLAERGREHLEQQVKVARFIGQFAVAKGGKELGKLFERLRPSSGPSPSTASATAAASARPPASAGGRPAPVGADATVASPSVDVDIPVRRLDGPSASSLAIADYDSLAASQVVPRLDGLTAEELSAVRDYEAAHRRRSTILGKINDLQAAPPA